MRTEIIDYINTLSLGSFTVSNELPWTDSGTTALYLKNLKKVYVDIAEYSHDTLLTTLDGMVINSDAISVRIYFACDAKQLPGNYDDLVVALRTCKDIDLEDGSYRRLSSVSTSFESDMLVTELQIRFTKLN